jgi:hypothetical protein
MKKETKLYWKTLFSVMWEASKEPLGMFVIIVAMASWLPAFIWWTGFFEDSDIFPRVIGTVGWAVGGLVATCLTLIAGDEIWKAAKKFHVKIKKKANAKIKKEKTAANRKLRAQGQREARRIQAMQDEADRTGMAIGEMGETMIEISPQTTKAERIIMEANGIETYERLKEYMETTGPNKFIPKKRQKKQKAQRKKSVKAVKSPPPKNRLEAVG